MIFTLHFVFQWSVRAGRALSLALLVAPPVWFVAMGYHHARFLVLVGGLAYAFFCVLPVWAMLRARRSEAVTPADTPPPGGDGGRMQ